MAPVRIPGEAGAAWRHHGIKDYVVDCDQELDKLLCETEGGKGLRIFVRVATPLGGAMLELSSKFGTSPANAGRLLKRIAGAGAQAALTFHVGSQCLSPFTYAQAVELARRAAVAAGPSVKITALDVGGGFPGSVSGQRRAAAALVLRHDPRGDLDFPAGAGGGDPVRARSRAVRRRRARS